MKITEVSKIDNFIWSNTYVIVIPEGRARQRKRRKMFEQIRADNL